tara:strand:+ start:25867 stop:27048 length:1182 start_codon:yes stop_codon:yes gene_type:complete
MTSVTPLTKPKKLLALGLTLCLAWGIYMQALRSPFDRLTEQERALVPQEEQATFAQALQQLYTLPYPRLSLKNIKAGHANTYLYVVKPENASGPEEAYFIRVMNKQYSKHKRERILRGTKSADELGIGPKVHYISPDKHLIAVAFIPGRTLRGRPVSKNILTHLGAHFRALHQKPPEPSFKRSLASRSKYYARNLKKQQNKHTPLFEEVFEAIVKIEKAFKKTEPQQVIAHLDLHRDNVMVSGQNVYLIDWENAGTDNRFTDLGIFSHLMNLDTDQQAHLLASYMGAPPTLQEQAKLKLMLNLARIKFGLWALEKALKMEPKEDNFLINLNLESLRQNNSIPGGPEYLSAYHKDEEKLITAKDFQKYGMIFLREFLLYTNSKAFSEDLETIQR